MDKHWSYQYVGMAYKDVTFDCGALVEKVQKEVFERDIHLSHSREYDGKKGITKWRAMNRQMLHEMESRVELTTEPREGDIILVTSRGYNQHIGVYCHIQGEPWMLHASDGAKQVGLIRLRDMEIRGMKVEGFYKWI